MILKLLYKKFIGTSSGQIDYIQSKKSFQEHKVSPGHRDICHCESASLIICDNSNKNKSEAKIFISSEKSNQNIVNYAKIQFIIPELLVLFV